VTATTELPFAPWWQNGGIVNCDSYAMRRHVAESSLTRGLDKIIQ
jgi:hypothetical protein